jgi:hypothetical protein
MMDAYMHLPNFGIFVRGENPIKSVFFDTIISGDLKEGSEKTKVWGGL